MVQKLLITTDSLRHFKIRIKLMKGKAPWKHSLHGIQKNNVGFPFHQFKKSKVKLSTLQNALQVKGEFRTIVRNRTRDVKTNFIVVEGRINSPPLLGENTLINTTRHANNKSRWIVEREE